MRRRSLLALLGSGALGSLAGCGGRESGPRPSPATGTTAEPSGTGTETETSTAEGTERQGTTGEPAARPDRPVIFLGPEQIQAIRSKVNAGEQPWASGARALFERANRALNATPRSVVDNGAPAGVDSAHKYGSDAPYQGKDGVYSDDIDRRDYEAALDMGDWIRSLAQAYALTRKDTYARKAIDLLHHWFLAPKTRMYPSANNFGPHTEGLKSQNSIEFYIFVPEMLYGASLVSAHPYWEQKANSVDALEDWTRRWQESLLYGSRGGPEGDEIYKWWVTTRAVTAAFLGDDAQLEAAFEDWRTTALTDFESRGSFKYARNRTRGLFYSLSAMNALTYCAEIASNYDVDLYNFSGDGETSVLKRAHDFHAQYVLNPSDWPWQELDGLDDGEREYGVSSYELSYSKWQTPKYLDVVRTATRPIIDWRILGPVTLTHGNTFALRG